MKIIFLNHFYILSSPILSTFFFNNISDPNNIRALLWSLFKYSIYLFSDTKYLKLFNIFYNYLSLLDVP